MNLVMSDNARNKLGCYMTRQASINNIPVSGLVSRFTVEPAVQQRFENASKDSTELTKKINVIGVTDQKGEKVLMDTTGPIARTNTSYDGTDRRNPITGYAAGAGTTPRGKSATQSGRRGQT